MSLAVTSLIWQHFKGQGAELLLALALGDYCGDDNGTMIFPSITALADKTRQSPRTVQRQLRAFERSGWLLALGSSPGRGKTRRYRINPDFMRLGLMEKGDNLSPFPAEKGDTAVSRKGDTAVSPERLLTQKKRASLKSKGTTNTNSCACGDPGIVRHRGGWLCRMCARALDPI